MARQGHRIMNNGIEVGKVVSGTFSPSLQKPIGIGYISKLNGEAKFRSAGDTIQIEIRGKQAPAKICRMPFVEPNVYKDG